MNETEKMRPLLRLLQGADADDEAVNPAGRQLKALATAMDEVNVFSKGQLMTWKNGLMNRASPACGEPAIVREVMKKPVYGESETNRTDGSPYFMEPLTLVIGVLDPDGTLLEFRVDGRRFQPFQP